MSRLSLSPDRKRWSWIAVVLAAAVLVALAALVLHRPEPVQATSNFMTVFAETYPAAADTRLNDCQLCHTSEAMLALNDYGSAYQTHGHNLPAIETLELGRRRLVEHRRDRRRRAGPATRSIIRQASQRLPWQRRWKLNRRRSFLANTS